VRDQVDFRLFNPTEEHRKLRETARRFGENALEPQAAQRDEEERFDLELFKRLGTELGCSG